MSRRNLRFHLTSVIVTQGLISRQWILRTCGPVKRTWKVNNLKEHKFYVLLFSFYLLCHNPKISSGAYDTWNLIHFIIYMDKRFSLVDVICLRILVPISKILTCDSWYVPLFSMLVSGFSVIKYHFNLSILTSIWLQRQYQLELSNTLVQYNREVKIDGVIILSSISGVSQQPFYLLGCMHFLDRVRTESVMYHLIYVTFSTYVLFFDREIYNPGRIRSFKERIKRWV